jgi:hypothetical protein
MPTSSSRVSATAEAAYWNTRTDGMSDQWRSSMTTSRPSGVAASASSWTVWSKTWNRLAMSLPPGSPRRDTGRSRLLSTCSHAGIALDQHHAATTVASVRQAALQDGELALSTYENVRIHRITVDRGWLAPSGDRRAVPARDVDLA